jgi:hypothetical protein
MTNSRGDYSTQVLPERILLGNVFCLSDTKSLICNFNSFFLIDTKDNSIAEIKVAIYPLEANSSTEIIQVANSSSLYIINHTTRDPERNNFENVTTTLYDGIDKVTVMPGRISFPISINNKIIGIDDNNRLVEFSPTTKTFSKILKFTQNITGLHRLKNNLFVVTDSNSMKLYELKDNKFSVIKQSALPNGLKTIHDFNDEYFVCYCFENFGNPENKIKNCKSKLEFWKKDSFTFSHEIEINGVLLTKFKLSKAFNSNVPILIACDLNSLFVINPENKTVNTINLSFSLSDFNLNAKGKLVVLVSDDKGISSVKQIDPDILPGLFNKPNLEAIGSPIDAPLQDQTFQTNNTNGKSTLTTSQSNGSIGFFPVSEKGSQHIPSSSNNESYCIAYKSHPNER